MKRNTRKSYVLVYKPEPEITDYFNDISESVREHQWKDGTTELLFELPKTLLSIEDEHNSFNRNKIEELLHTDYTDTVVSSFTDAETSEWVDISNNDVTSFFSIYDLIPDQFADIADIINRESPGGDIRKYANNLYGIYKFSFEIGTLRSRKLTITGFDPYSINSIEELVELGYMESGMYEGDDPRYPPAERVIEWADRVNNTWNLECGAIGSIHCDLGGSSSDILSGLDGFVIYDADEDVKKWTDKNWNSSDPEYPFMYPDEYDFRKSSDFDHIHRDRIRMWWD